MIREFRMISAMGPIGLESFWVQERVEPKVLGSSHLDDFQQSGDGDIHVCGPSVSAPGDMMICGFPGLEL
jgi:hypothetical protein